MKNGATKYQISIGRRGKIEISKRGAQWKAEYYARDLSPTVTDWACVRWQDIKGGLRAVKRELQRARDCGHTVSEVL